MMPKRKADDGAAADNGDAACYYARKKKELENADALDALAFEGTSELQRIATSPTSVVRQGFENALAAFPTSPLSLQVSPLSSPAVSPPDKTAVTETASPGNFDGLMAKGGFESVKFTIHGAGGAFIAVSSVLGAPQSDAIAKAVSEGRQMLVCDEAFMGAETLAKIHDHIYGQDVVCASFEEALQVLRAAKALGMGFLSSAALGRLRVLTTPEVALEAHKWVRLYGSPDQLAQLEVFTVRHLAAVSLTAAWRSLSWPDIEAWIGVARQASTAAATLLHSFLQWYFRTSSEIGDAKVENFLLTILVSNSERPRLASLLSDWRASCQESAVALRRWTLVQRCMERKSDAWGFLVDVATQHSRDLVLTSKGWEPVGSLHMPLMGLTVATFEQSFFTFGGMYEEGIVREETSFPTVHMRELFPSLANRAPWPATSAMGQLGARPPPSSLLLPGWRQNASRMLVSPQKQDLSIVDAASALARNHFGIVVGGCDAVTGEMVSSVSAFLFGTREWVRLTPLPRPRVAACAAWLCLEHDRRYALVVTAGCDEYGRAEATTLGLEFTCAIAGAKATWSWSSKWQELAPLGEPRFAAGCCVVGDDTMVVAGGVSSAEGAPLDSVVTLRVPGGTRSVRQLAVAPWTSTCALPAPRHSMGVFGVASPDGRRRVIVVGGRDADHVDLASVMQTRLCDNPADPPPAWQLIPHTLPEPRSSFGYAVVDAAAELSLLVVGGVSETEVLDSIIALELDFRTRFFASSQPGVGAGAAAGAIATSTASSSSTSSS